MGRQVGIAMATDEVGSVSVLVSLKPKRNEHVTIMLRHSSGVHEMIMPLVVIIPAPIQTKT